MEVVLLALRASHVPTFFTVPSAPQQPRRQVPADREFEVAYAICNSDRPSFSAGRKAQSKLVVVLASFVAEVSPLWFRTASLLILADQSDQRLRQLRGST